ncbi:hypothetical protein FACS1894189_7200 [Planctomycetales bacterium]|nr:hypothetical protein FACS1894189_7200 [Planctomycetales bacterium]
MLFGEEDGVFLTKSEFEAFMQQYHGDHSPKPGGKSLAWSKGKISITPYGYINLSASYETEKTVTGDYAVYANSKDTEDDPGFNVDPKSTRLGFKLDGPGLHGWHRSKTSGAIEFDFQGAYQSRNRGGLLLRKAFITVGDGKTTLLAGQDWEVVSPLFPKTLNYTAGACVGNVGYRRAMLRADHRFDFCNNSNLTTQFAIADNVYREADTNGLRPSSARYPIIEGRAAYSFGKGSFAHGKPVVLGVSSHIGEERFNFGPDQKYLKTWSFNVDFDLPVTKILTFQMEYFLGENLATIEGGILQGVDSYRKNTIRAQGGWAGLTGQWTKKLQTNFVYMIDDPFNDDIVTGNAAASGLYYYSRNYSHCLFFNVLYNWTENLMTGFEVDFWRTHWQKSYANDNFATAMQPGTPVRYEFTVRYTF